MSRELDLLAKQFQRGSVTVLRSDVSLYQTTAQTAAAAFLRSVEQHCRKQKQPSVTLVAVIHEDTKQ